MALAKTKQLETVLVNWIYDLVENSGVGPIIIKRKMIMKRHGDIYDKICDIDNIRKAHKHASKGKKHYKEVKFVNENPEYYFHQIMEMLADKTYEVSEYSVETVNDNGKERELYKLPYYPDRIIQWAVMLQTEPIFVKSLTNFTCSSIKGRGGSKSEKLIEKYIRKKENVFCLKLDIKKYYPSIDHKILKSLLRRKFKDKDLLWLFNRIIDSYPNGKGIPIGSYTSQHFANFYLCKFDHWLKEVKGVKYCVRYMDDIVIVHKSKEFLHDLLKDIEIYLRKNLKLKVKKNWQVFPIDIRGIDFVGYRFFKDFKLLRKSICKRYKKRMNEVSRMVSSNSLTEHAYRSTQSYKGWVQNCDSYRLLEKYHNPNIEALEDFMNNKRRGEINESC